MALILLVCTGNVCRSPIAEGFLKAGLGARLGEDSPSVASAGTVGWEGSGAMPESVDAAAELGVDISGHIARRLLVSHVGSSDVVIGIASEHREAVVRAMPDAAPRTFTLKELVRLLEAQPVATASRDPGAQLLARVAAADELRRSGFEGNPNDEDVVDPLGQPLESYRAIAWELEEWCSRLADGLFGKAAAPARTGAEG